MTADSRFLAIAKGVLGVGAGVLVFFLFAVLWNYAARYAIALRYMDVPNEFGLTQQIVAARFVYVPTGLLSGLALLVAWMIDGKWAGIVAALVSLACTLTFAVFLRIATHVWI